MDGWMEVDGGGWMGVFYIFQLGFGKYQILQMRHTPHAAAPALAPAQELSSLRLLSS